MSRTAVLVDIDTEKETEIMLNIVRSLGLKCKVLKSRSGGHFLFKINKPMPNRTKVPLGIGIMADIKGDDDKMYEKLLSWQKELVLKADASL